MHCPVRQAQETKGNERYHLRQVEAQIRQIDAELHRLIADDAGLEAVKPTHSAASAARQPSEGFVAADPGIMTNRQLGAVGDV